MSIKITSQVWALKLPSEQKLVLLALADFADDHGRKCFPGKKRLARMTGKSPRAVQRILQALKEKKLAIPALYEKGGRGNATEFHLHPENGERVETETRTTPLSDEKGRRAERERETPETEKGDDYDRKRDARVSPSVISVIEPPSNPEEAAAIATSISNGNEVKAGGLDGLFTHMQKTYHAMTGKVLTLGKKFKAAIAVEVQKESIGLIGKSWSLFLQRDRGMEGLRMPAEVFLQELPDLVEVINNGRKDTPPPRDAQVRRMEKWKSGESEARRFFESQGYTVEFVAGKILLKRGNYTSTLDPESAEKYALAGIRP